MNCIKKKELEKEITQYVSETFKPGSSQYKMILSLELNKIKQQNQIQIPFILRYYKRNIRKAKILDIGCGTGGATVAWALRGAGCVGIDMSEKDLRIAMLRAASEGVKPLFKQVKGTKLPFGKESFDLVICDQVLEHVPDFNETIKEIGRVLKKNSIAYIDLPNRFFPFDPHYRLLFAHWTPQKIHRFLVKVSKRKYYDYPVFFRAYNEIKNSILKNGFEIIADSKNFIQSSESKGAKYAVAKLGVKLVPFYFFSPTLQFVIKKK